MMGVERFSKACRLILEHLLFQFSSPLTRSDFPSRMEDTNIRLALRDAEYLPRENLKVRRCPQVRNSLFRHYMTSSAEKNGLLVYERYRVREFVVPIVFITGVNWENFEQ